MYKKILISNRSEISMRIANACKELGAKTAIVVSKPDFESHFANYCDEKYLLDGEPLAAYLDIAQIIKIAKQNSCDAIHPGYGFLSENANFAKACQDSGIAFIGPNYKIIEQMGSKINAREILSKHDIPLVPGVNCAISDHNEVLDFAKKYGYPIAVKASGGGGGRGFAVIENESQISTAIDKATKESIRYFADPKVYIEKFFYQAKHIEVQIMADNFSNVCVLGERDCSTQRRHQKLIEESPANSLDPNLRKKLHETAIKIAKVIDYNNIGTIEFLVSDNDIYFLEVNTRIQVEHPVTELTTRIDIAKEQIKLAYGKKLDLKNVTSHGHAIEFRILAEDASKGFMPNFGKITQFDAPNLPFCRLDTHCHSNYEVLPYYDSLLAKLIVWDNSRQEAISKARLALNNFKISGIKTTLDFYQEFLNDDLFLNDKVYTSYIESKYLAYYKALKKPEVKHQEQLSLPNPINNEVTNSKSITKYKVKVNNEIFDVEVCDVKNNGTKNGAVKFKPKQLSKNTTGFEYVTVSMPGLIKNIFVKQGDNVSCGQKLFSIEAMKMESDVVSSIDGRVEKINVELNQTVQADYELMTIKAL